jgi:alpha-L-fucosidase 2
MLIQSHNGVIRLLPALPAAWYTGEFRGLRARGGFEFDLKWKDGKVTEAWIYSNSGGKARVHYNGVETGINLKPGDRKLLKIS